MASTWHSSMDTQVLNTGRGSRHRAIQTDKMRSHKLHNSATMPTSAHIVAPHNHKDTSVNMSRRALCSTVEGHGVPDNITGNVNVQLIGSRRIRRVLGPSRLSPAALSPRRSSVRCAGPCGIIRRTWNVVGDTVLSKAGEYTDHNYFPAGSRY